MGVYPIIIEFAAWLYFMYGVRFWAATFVTCLLCRMDPSSNLAFGLPTVLSLRSL